jgi:hypothetical protein
MTDIAALEKVSLAAKRLTNALEMQKLAFSHLSLAIAETEASRQDLHDVGKQCWIDRLDHEPAEAEVA